MRKKRPAKSGKQGSVARGGTKRRRVQARTLETRRRLLDAAAVEFADKGYEGSSTRSIATAAGLKHPLLTYHFETKDGLWRAVLTDLNERFRNQFNERLAGLRGVDEVTTLRLMLEEFIHFSNSHPEFHWLMSNAARARSERLRWLCEEFIRPNVEQITSLIRTVQAQGRFVTGDPMHLFYLFIGAVTRIYMVSAEVEILTGEAPTSPEFLRQHIQACLSLFFRER